MENNISIRIIWPLKHDTFFWVILFLKNQQGKWKVLSSVFQRFCRYGIRSSGNSCIKSFDTLVTIDWTLKLMLHRIVTKIFFFRGSPTLEVLPWWLILCVTLIGHVQMKHYFWVHLWWCSQIRLTFDSVKYYRLPSLMWMSPVEGLTRTKDERRKNSFLFPLPHCWADMLSYLLSLVWNLYHHFRCFSGLWPLNYTISFPKSPSYRWQIVGLLTWANSS